MSDEDGSSDRCFSTLVCPSMEDEFNDDIDDADEDVDFDEALIPTLGKKSAEILIDIDENRKKVITLDDDNRNLEEVFYKAIAEDATFKEYVDSTVIFQIFNHKFNTWVDLDSSKELADGTRLKAIFEAKAKPDTGIGHSHKSRKCRKRRRSYSSDDSSGKNRKCKTLCSSEENLNEKKKVCRSVKTCSSDDERCASTTVPVSCHHANGSTQFDGQEVQKCKMVTGSIDTLWKEQVSGSNSSPTVSQGELCALSLGLTSKHPVSALHELCTRLRWGAPQFEMHEQCLVSSDPKFLMKVTVRGHTYIPDTPSRRKQLAKAAAAEYCLKQLGVLK